MPYTKDDRRYYHTPIGQLRSVTSYLDELAKPALVGWAAGIAAEYFKDHLALIKSGEVNVDAMDVETLVKEAKAHHKLMSEQAKETGTEVHKAVENYYTFGEAPSDPVIAALRDEAVSMINDKLHFIVDAAEQEVYHPIGYAGTLDIIGKAAPGLVKKWAKAVLDLKTGKRIYKEAKMQVAAYAEAWEKVHEEQVYYAIILRIDKESGKPAEVVIMKRPEWKRQFKAFKKLVEFCRCADKLKSPKKGKAHDEV